MVWCCLQSDRMKLALNVLSMTELTGLPLMKPIPFVTAATKMVCIGEFEIYV